MYAQCDRNGNKYFLWEVIIDHRKNDSALSAEDQKVVVEGQETIIKLIAGWDICCGWKDGSTLWEKLSNLKESHPIQVAEYAIAQEHVQAFNWWVHHVLKTRECLISQKYPQFGLELCKMVKEAVAFDKKNKTTLQQDAIETEMKNVRIAFQPIPEGEKPPNGFLYVNHHMVFGIKMEDFCRKACLVTGGHMTYTLDVITYSIVVTRETVCIPLTMAHYMTQRSRQQTC